MYIALPVAVVVWISEIIGIDRNLPWTEFVDAYHQNYLYGPENVQGKNFDLLFGLEEHVGDGLEILLCGITADLMAAHPELKMATAEKYAEVVHAAGGLGSCLHQRI